MKLIERYFILHLLVCIASLAVGYALGATLPVALGAVALGASWYLANQRNLHGIEFLMLFAVVLAAGALLYWYPQVPRWLSLAAVIAALGAWDLDYFLQRLKLTSHDSTNPRLWIDHLRRLGLVEGAGFLLGLVGLNTRLELSFWAEFILALLAAVGLSRLISYLRREMR